MGVRTCKQCHKKVASHFKTCPFCKGALPGSGKRPGGLTLSQAVKNVGTAIVSVVENGLASDNIKPAPDAAENDERPKPAARPRPKATLIECNDCGQEVSRNAKSCPNCGSEKYDAATATAENIFNIVVLLVLIYALYQCGGVFFGDSETETPPEVSAAKQRDRDAGMARAGAQTVLKKTLRDPGSYEEIRHSVIPHKTKENVLGVYLKYRAKNGFGGYEVGDASFLCVRGTYSCTRLADD